MAIKSGTDSYRILGVDPGTNIFGYSIIECQGNDINLIDYGVFRLEKYEDHHSKLKEIYLQLQEIIETYLPQQLAIEAPFFGKNVQSMLKLGRAQGVAIAAAITMGLEIVEYAPKKIKLSITGNGNASKEQVAAMLEYILKVKLTAKHLDATDALGVAVCHVNQSRGMKPQQKRHNTWADFAKQNPGKIK